MKGPDKTEIGKQKWRDTRTDSGGGFTLSKAESLNGMIEVWVAPDAAAVGNRLGPPAGSSKLSDDGKPLYFADNSVVDAHEFGHAYDYIAGLPDGTNSVTFENARRSALPGTQRRKSEK